MEFIRFLQTLYDSDRPAVDQNFDYAQALRDIEIFMIHSQVYHLMKSTGRLDSAPEFFRYHLKKHYEVILFQNMVLRHHEDRICKALDELSIDAIPLKGTRFAERAFGHFAARGTSDIDILVRPRDLKRAVDCVKAMGFTPEKKIHNHAVLYKEHERTANPLVVELHWTLEKKFGSDLDDGRFWKKASRIEPYSNIYEMSLIHTFYYICLHGIRHRMDSLKYTLDIAQLLERYGDRIDYALLLEQAARDKTVRRIQTALSIVYSQFPYLHSVKPLPFPVLNTHWDYKMIRDHWLGTHSLSFYRYRLFFKFRIYDTWKHRILSQKQFYDTLAKNGTWD